MSPKSVISETCLNSKHVRTAGPQGSLQSTLALSLLHNPHPHAQPIPTPTLLMFSPQSGTFFHGLGHTFFQLSTQMSFVWPIPNPKLSKPTLVCRAHDVLSRSWQFVFMFDGLPPSTGSVIRTRSVTVLFMPQAQKR